MIKQHPTAIISPKAELGENVEIGPFAIINDDVVIGDNCSIGSHVVIYDGARLAKNVKIYQGGSIANTPQDLKFGDEKTYLHIGENTVIREFAALHRGTGETKNTTIGSDCLLMAYSHVAHDCVIGNKVILVNGVQVGGHVHIDDWAIIGGMTPVHQFCRVGKHVMVGGGFRVTQDVPPFVMVAGSPLKYSGLNVVGLRRRGFTTAQIELLKQVYNYVYGGQLNTSQALQVIRESLPADQLIQDVADFISASKRGITGK